MLNMLHYAAMFAGVQIMQVLAAASIQGLDPAATDWFGDTPTAFFYTKRGYFCSVIRGRFELEEEAWWNLMESACRQNGIDFETFEPEWWAVHERNRRDRVTVLSTDEVDDKSDSTQSVADESDQFSDAVEDQVA